MMHEDGIDILGETVLMGEIHRRPNDEPLKLEDTVQLIPLQFTGLLDKNGVEIYEYDIVRLSYGTAIVKYIDECGAFMLQWIDDAEANMELVAFSNNGYRLGRSRAWEKDIPEIIGNIHSNSEL
jgi:uncharacterized phage protein (TIGR01671 family)